MNKNIGGLATGVIVIAFCALGWIMNIFKLADCDFNSPYKCEIAHGAGLFPPVGAITGYITTDEL